ncbi:MAG: FAD-binding oxidoreductase [Pyrinomonadaceae bacterium]
MDKLVENLRAIVGREAVLADPGELLVYECDGLPQHKYVPQAVVFPKSTAETSEVMRVLALAQVPFTPRGAGTGLSGGALALNRGVVIEMARMREILSIDDVNRTIRVQTGVVNAHVSRAVAHLGLHYVPDPSSQGTCTIGGNIAENAGGIHCLKYGTTTDHVLGARVVLAGGDVVDLGGEVEQSGYDLLGVFVGSEGTFGIATEATLRLVPVPPAVRTLLAEFEEVDAASHAVSAIIAAGIMPAALEMMDGEIIRAVEASVFAAGLSLDIGAALLIELDGLEAGIDHEAERVKSICLNYGARTCRLARDEPERKKLWAARKGAFGAVGRIAPDSMIQDAVVPRSRLPEVMADAYRIAARFHLRLANVFHAGDGNLHPFICFDSRSPEEVLRVKEAGRELMETCVRAGGTITGEHGVGLDKRDFLPLIFSEDDMDVMLRVRRAFDPLGLCNPGKIIPLLKGCGEARVLSEPGAVATGLPPGLTPASQQRGAASLNLAGAWPERQSLSALESGTAAYACHHSFDPDGAAKQITAIVGEANISASPHLPFSLSPSLSASPVLLVTPTSIDEIREVMKLADREAWSVVPAGAATWLEVGNQLKSVNMIVSTARLNRILDHEPADLVASAQAGITLDDLNSHLAGGGQCLPLDPPNDGRATIGGVVATGLSGPQRFGYGAARNFVIGMQVVLADGRLVKAGGRVVKNVAGYDLCKLFTGSYGTLGLITELTFKLRPLPQRTWTVLVWGEVESLLAGARKIVSANLFPSAVELLSPAFTATADYAERNEALLLVKFAGSRDAVEKQTLESENLLKTHGRCRGPLIKGDSNLWRVLSGFPITFPEKCVWRATVPPSQLTSFLHLVEQTTARSDAPEMWQASVADGRIRVIEQDNDSHRQTAERLQRLRSEAETLGGSLVLENAALEVKSRIDAWGGIGKHVEVMQRIKQSLDPQNILSPGRFRFEIEEGPHSHPVSNAHA